MHTDVDTDRSFHRRSQTSETTAPLPEEASVASGQRSARRLAASVLGSSLFSVSAFVGGCRDNIKRLLSVARTNAHERCRDRKTMQIVVVAL